MNKKLGIIVQTNFSKLQKNFLVRFFISYLSFCYFLFFFRTIVVGYAAQIISYSLQSFKTGSIVLSISIFFIILHEKIKKVITRNNVIGLLVNHFKDHLIVTRKTISTGFVPCEKEFFFLQLEALCAL